MDYFINDVRSFMCYRSSAWCSLLWWCGFNSVRVQKENPAPAYVILLRTSLTFHFIEQKQNRFLLIKFFPAKRSFLCSHGSVASCFVYLSCIKSCYFVNTCVLQLLLNCITLISNNASLQADIL